MYPHKRTVAAASAASRSLPARVVSLLGDGKPLGAQQTYALGSLLLLLLMCACAVDRPAKSNSTTPSIDKALSSFMRRKGGAPKRRTKQREKQQSQEEVLEALQHELRLEVRCAVPYQRRMQLTHVYVVGLRRPWRRNLRCFRRRRRSKFDSVSPSIHISAALQRRKRPATLPSSRQRSPAPSRQPRTPPTTKRDDARLTKSQTMTTTTTQTSPCSRTESPKKQAIAVGKGNLHQKRKNSEASFYPLQHDQLTQTSEALPTHSDGE